MLYPDFRLHGENERKSNFFTSLISNFKEKFQTFILLPDLSTFSLPKIKSPNASAETGLDILVTKRLFQDSLQVFANGNVGQASRDTSYKRYDRELLTIDGNSLPWLLRHVHRILLLYGARCRSLTGGNRDVSRQRLPFK